MPHHFFFNVRQIVALCGIALSANAWGFSEDICYYFKNPTEKSGDLNPAPFNCWDLQCRDGATSEAPSTAASCVVTGLARYADATFGGFHTRNSIHFDITWLSARLRGIKSSDAQRLAVFAEATDLGLYQHYDYQGLALTTAVSDNIAGVQRTNMDTNGFWLHFVPWKKIDSYAQNTSELTYTPTNSDVSPFPTQEVPLAHLRAWAFGLQDDLCEFGMTDTGQALGKCLTSTSLYYDVPILADPKDTVDIRVQPKQQPMLLSWQRIQQTSDCNDRGCYQRDYAKVKAGSLEALGIYLHALGDRLSHHYCSDASYISKTWEGTGTPRSAADYYLFYPDICGTTAHVALHYPETGQSVLPERSRDAINFTYQEIAAWVTATKYASETKPNPNRGFPMPASTEAVTLLMERALTGSTASERIHNLCNLAKQGYSLDWHDNNPDCTYSIELDLPQAGSIAGVSSGRLWNMNLTALLRPAKDHESNNSSLVIVARTKDNQWFSLTPSGFSPSLDGVLEPYKNGKLNLQAITILNGSVDLTLYKDTEIYLGYGSSLAEIISSKRYSKIGVLR